MPLTAEHISDPVLLELINCNQALEGSLEELIFLYLARKYSKHSTFGDLSALDIINIINMTVEREDEDLEKIKTYIHSGKEIQPKIKAMKDDPMSQSQMIRGALDRMCLE